MSKTAMIRSCISVNRKHLIREARLGVSFQVFNPAYRPFAWLLLVVSGQGALNGFLVWLVNHRKIRTRLKMLDGDERVAIRVAPPHSR